MSRGLGDVYKRQISRIENGGCGVGIASYIKIADALGVKLGSLVGF